MDYIANVDTAKYLALEILPRLRQRYPQASLMLVGSKPTPAVKVLEAPTWGQGDWTSALGGGLFAPGDGMCGAHAHWLWH
jgi:hypothetical protein